MRKVAEERGVEPSTVMRTVQALEASEGRQLVRTRNGVPAKLTRTGRGLVKRSQPLLKVPPAK